jgi:hypothetical protein
MIAAVMGSRLKMVLMVALAIAVLAGIALDAAYRAWKRDEPRREVFQTAQRLLKAMRAPPSTGILEEVVVPPALESRTPAEQSEFLRKALQDEISTEGLAVLRKEGRFGTLKEIFPQEAEKWAEQAGVNAQDCLAFRLDRNGLTAELVVLRNEPFGKIVRCNNISQLAGR